MILSDRDIRKELAKGNLFSGDKELYIGPSSVDLHLDNKAWILVPSNSDEIMDCKQDNSKFFESYDNWDNLVIHPGEFYILSTNEKVILPDNIAGFLQGRSSLARLGLNIHAAGFFDPGFSGNATLEVSNFTNIPIKIYPGMRICQMVFVYTYGPASGYKGKSDAKYSGQSGPTLTKIHLDQ